jgi:putative drug exporter of the RND superfamily
MDGTTVNGELNKHADDDESDVLHLQRADQQIERMTDTASAMGQAFDDAKSDDYFYLPPEAFDSPDFQRGLKLMLSPDGKSAQFIITHDVDPATPEGISHVDAEMQAAKEAVKGTPSSSWSPWHRW